MAWEMALAWALLLFFLLWFWLGALPLGGPPYGIYVLVAVIILYAFLADRWMKKASRAARTLAWLIIVAAFVLFGALMLGFFGGT